MKFFASLLQTSLLVLLLSSCASSPVQTAYFDLGSQMPAASAAASCKLPPLQLSEITSSNALADNLMIYRLLYANAQQSQSFAAHRWSMPPAQLLAQRIKTSLAQDQVRLIDAGLANPDGWQLRLELNDFSQYFSDSSHSTAKIALRASLIRGNLLLAQTTLSRAAPASRADAPAGAAAMTVASDALINDLSSWLCSQPRP